MTVIPDILAQLARLDACANVPRVKALHLPPPHAVAASRIAGRGEFCALELTDGTLGLAYVLLDDHSDALREGQGLDGLVGASALDIARGLLGPQGVNRVLGWAAVMYIVDLFQANAAMMTLVIVGGILYTLGAVVYAMKRPNPNISTRP